MAEHNDSVKQHLTGMYQDWFLDYASYVILERAVPAIEDGLKPVQRRILHAMKAVFASIESSAKGCAVDVE